MKMLVGWFFPVIKNELARYFQLLELFHSKMPITQNIRNCVFFFFLKTIVLIVKSKWLSVRLRT